MANPIYPPFKKVQIQLHVEDQVSKGYNAFNNIKEFVSFLNDNPEIAKELGYEPKPRK